MFSKRVEELKELIRKKTVAELEKHVEVCIGIYEALCKEAERRRGSDDEDERILSWIIYVFSKRPPRGDVRDIYNSLKKFVDDVNSILASVGIRYGVRDTE